MTNNKVGPSMEF